VPELEARLVQRYGLRGVVVGADDLRVPSRAAGADVRALEHRDVADTVALSEVVRDRETDHTTADDHHVIAGLRRDLVEERRPPEQAAHVAPPLLAGALHGTGSSRSRTGRPAPRIRSRR
jgi:hypothetical protein